MINKVKIGDEVGKAWKLYKENFGLLFGATWVVLLIGSATCGLLVPPLVCGLYMLIDKVQNPGAEKPSLSLVFKGFDKFLPALCSTLILQVLAWVALAILSIIFVLVPVVGQLAGVFFGFVAGILTSLAQLHVAHSNMGTMDTVKTVLKGTFNGEYTNFIIAGVVFSLIASAGALVCGIGLLFTFPFGYVALAVAYRTAFGEGPTPALPPAAETASV